MIKSSEGMPNQDAEGKARLDTMSYKVLHSLIDSIKGIESPDWTNKLDNGLLTILHPEIIHEMLDQIQEKELNSPAASSEHLTTVSGDTMQEILKRIQVNGSDTPLGKETLWDRRMLARPYAQTLLGDALKGKQVDKIESDLKKVVHACQSGDTTAFLEDPEVRFEDKNQHLAAELGDLHPLVMNLVYRLMEQKQLCVLSDILDEYRRRASGRNFVARAEIITAVPLVNEDIQRISQRLSHLVGQKVFLEPQVDPGIIGGFIIKLGSTRMDASLRSELTSLRKAMNK